MRRIYWVLLGVAVAIILLIVYVSIVKPVLVLPTVIYRIPANTSISAFQQKLAINQLDVRARTDGKMFVIADGQEIGYVTYNLRSLLNAASLAEKMSLPPAAITTVRLIPILFPGFMLNALVAGQTVYSVLPIEVTVRFLPS